MDSTSDNIVRGVSIIYRKTGMYLAEQLEGSGLSGAMLPFVSCLCKFGPISQHRLGCVLSMDKSTVAKTVAKLEEQGYVERRTNPEDARSYDLTPTQKAYDMEPRLEKIRQDWAKLATKGLTAVERAIFFELMGRIEANCHEYFEKQTAEPAV